MLFLITYYSILLFSSGVMFYNTYKMWKLDHDFTLVISNIFIYYFTLGGALIFPLDAYLGFKGAEIGLHYLPIFEKLFVVSFDYTYLHSTILYIAFILIFQYVYLYFTQKSKHSLDNNVIKENSNKARFEINPYFILTLSVTLIFMSFYFLRREILYAIANEKSIYLITRANTNPNYTLHQLANEFSVIIPYIAFAFASLKSNKFNIGIKAGKYSLWILFIACLVSSLYIAMLGNRREILSAIIICLLIALNERSNLYPKRLITITSIVVFIFLANNIFRSTIIPEAINSLLHPTAEQDIVLKKDEASAIERGAQISKSALGSFIFSNELFYAHFSMYGVIHKQVPITYGSSIKYLAVSLIPRSIYNNRPPDIYSYYAKEVGAVPGQIYTIHHATAWYLNFGIAGIIIGAVVLAGIFIFSYRIRYIKTTVGGNFMVFVKFLMPYLVCGQIVTFITAGPEAYKAMIIEGVIIPIVILGICTKKYKLNNG